MKKSTRYNVRVLANEAGIEIDHALVSLWDAGFNNITSPSDNIQSSELKQARRALDLPTASELRSAHYWEKRLGLNSIEFRDLLKQHGIQLSQNSRRLPKGTVKIVQKLAQQRETFSVGHPSQTRSFTTSSVAPKLRWRIIGHEKPPRFLSYKELEAIHWELARDYEEHNDPIDPPGISSTELLESAVFRAQTSLNGIQKYPTVEMSAATLLHSLLHNHPFYNGNKRTALVALLVFLDVNNILLTCYEDALFKFILQISQHRIDDPHPKDRDDRETIAIAKWIYDNSRTIQKGERPLPFHKIRSILDDYGCYFEFGRSGSKINIKRDIKSNIKTIFGYDQYTLCSQIYYGGDGKEVDRNTINKIRKDLQLDEKNEVDSAAFYEDSSRSTSDFIIKYRKTLDRLSIL